MFQPTRLKANSNTNIFFLSALALVLISVTGCGVTSDQNIQTNSTQTTTSNAAPAAPVVEAIVDVRPAEVKKADPVKTKIPPAAPPADIQAAEVKQTEPVETKTPPAVPSSVYKDGTYSATGEYRSPAGPEAIGVTLTLKNDIVVEAVVEAKATATKSQMMQADFIANYKQFVIGKNIDEVVLGKVSGSSLTPKGFNEAVTKIKAEAKK